MHLPTVSYVYRWMEQQPKCCAVPVCVSTSADRCGVQPGATRNVMVLDDTAFVCTATESARAELTEEPSPFLDSLANDLDYVSPTLTAVTENASVYVAGWVVRKAVKSLSCDICHASLVTSNIPHEFCDSCHLLRLRNKGGLVIPIKR
jgi:hypothetical protein